MEAKWKLDSIPISSINFYHVEQFDTDNKEHFTNCQLIKLYPGFLEKTKFFLQLTSYIFKTKLFRMYNYMRFLSWISVRNHLKIFLKYLTIYRVSDYSHDNVFVQIEWTKLNRNGLCHFAIFDIIKCDSDFLTIGIALSANVLTSNDCAK